ncbi:MAG: nitrile hydratase subunit beta [Acidiferrobacterales bacterium]|nr:nitrile hydratase subunit beta [Acidiferrobacterales bacterium]
MLKGKDVWDTLHRGSSTRMLSRSAGKLSIGTKVRAKTLNYPGHTRLPEFAKGREGVIASDQGTFIFPDAHAKGDKRPQRLYSVRFEGDELWGAEASQSPTAVYVDLFESYLETV